MNERYPEPAVIVLSIFLSLAQSAALANSGEASAEQIELGGDLYKQYCDRCHEAPATGLAAFQGSLQDLTERLEGITDEMPDFWGVFSDDEIAALYAYMQSSKQGE